MKKYDYFLLDWDGNLAKTLDIWLEACRAPLEKRELTLTDEQIAAMFGGVIKQLRLWGIADPETIFDEMDVIAKRKLPDVELYPDALEVLEGLRAAHKKLALITTSLHENIDHLLEKYSLAPYFDVVIAGDDVKQHKPDPEPLERALKILGADKGRAVMIGDSDKDIRAAKNTGIDSILFYPPEHRKFYHLASLKQLRPTYIVEDFRDILEAL